MGGGGGFKDITLGFGEPVSVLFYILMFYRLNDYSINWQMIP